jgi:hypothetical protein
MLKMIFSAQPPTDPESQPESIEKFSHFMATDHHQYQLSKLARHIKDD